MIQPTIGRKVWFRHNNTQPFPLNIWDQEQPLDATVVFVHGDRLVNLLVIDHGGDAHAIRSVQLVQEGDALPVGAYCEWMPFQQGQAKRAAEPYEQGPHD